MKVLVGVAIAGSLLLGVGLGRLSGRLSPASPEVPPGQIEPKDRITLSEEQLRRSGLSIIRPELSTGTERPISGFVEAAVGARSSAAMPVEGRLVRLLVAPGMAVRAGEVIAEVRSPEAAVVQAEAGAAQATAQSLAYQYRLAIPMARQGALSAQELESRRIASVTAASSARATAAKAAAIGQPDARGGLLIRSHSSGQVTAVKAYPGAVLREGEELAQISDARGSEMRFLVSPLLAANLKSGQLLRVKAGAQELRARVVAVAADGGGDRRFTVVRAQAVDGPMPPAGTAVTAFLLVASAEQRFTVPAEAVQMVKGIPVVFRYQRGGAEPMPVVIGKQSGGRVEIAQGLRGGERLLSGNTGPLSLAISRKEPLD